MKKKRQGSWNQSQAGRSPSVLSNRLLIEVGSIVIFALGIFVLCSLLTYDANDPSFLSNYQGVANNACGWVGAWISTALFHALGLGAFLVPAALGFLAVTLHQKEGWVRLTGILGGMTVAVLALAVFVSIQWQTVEFNDATLLTGGTLGAWVSQLLIQPLNPLGASIVSVVTLCVAVVLSTPLSLAQATGKGVQWFSVATWKVLRVSGTYLFYLFGIFFVKLVHIVMNYVAKGLSNTLKSVVTRLSEVKVEIPSMAPKRIKVIEPKIGPDETEAEVSGEETEPVWETSPEPVTLASEQLSDPIDIVLEKNKAKASEPKTIKAKVKKRGNWKLPTTQFLVQPPKIETEIDRTRLVENSQILKQKLLDFGIEGEVTAVRPGPVITLYEFKPGAGVKVSKIAALADDLAMALSADNVRILAPLPGRAVVGIEIPSDQRETVYLREFLQQEEFYNDKFSIPLAMGKDIGGHPVISDLARMPHLLCAGQTGSGKSVFMNSLICSLLYRFTPDEMRMILVDPKFIEFRAYQDIPHLLLPVVDDPKEANTALKWAVREMERRYRILAMMGVRNLKSFNSKVEEMGVDVVRDLLFAEENSFAQASSGMDWVECFEQDERGAPRVSKLPFVVVVIDELADLMMVAKKDVEISIARIAQKARAAGIHLIIATQRPSTDVVTGLIKANLPSRASFQLASHIDSKTILDRAGAERLLGQGDLLFVPPGSSQLNRVHACYVNDEEIEKIASFLKSQGTPDYREEILVEDEEAEDAIEEDEPLFQEAVSLVRSSQQASASFLQRHLKVGYNRAARMIESMETKGIVGPADGSRPREVLIQ